MNQFIHIIKEGKKRIEFSQEGKYVVFFHNVSAQFEFEIMAPKVELYIYGLYTGRSKSKYELSTIQHHTAPNSFSHLFVKGVFDEASSFIYDGLIKIDPFAHGSHAYQKNQNIILSPDVFVSSKPNLEILANDVYCTHGSTTGKMNGDAIFLLQSKGIPRDLAKRVFITGFLNEIFDNMIAHVPNTGAVKSLREQVVKKYD
ncbi:hypothetical protein COY90_01050 [Candidatus Roizmanbacteria bacterium CG_4_10_14_0_8_um_filter_39_9]|uniref:SUF system FeS cluster assembly SufBD core domain-containing protein n=1 Tax=Candidatus Roizmanbacteria bacterium CG_4_10_14_0_8_um_filter_39_9 TaxID=1974829 RepID=A0A2M7QDR8_9BACT|nr:MAG: hypothetical protein COY90_01050 [Candidatus Roizmanbacteria bacterium CG_4_10_14_0_8_um_filter_39_9]